MANLCMAEYLWLDGATPTRGIRSKARIIPFTGEPELSDFPEWSFDGSSTAQASGEVLTAF